MNSYKPVTAALRVLEVLASVNRLEGTGTVKDIHYQTGIDKSTIVRMLETLISAGYVVKAATTPTYFVTGKTLMLSSSFDRRQAFGEIVAPFLSELRDDIGWPSDIGLFDHDAMLVIETSRISGPLSFNRSTGYRAPILGTSLGLAYAAFTSSKEQREICEAESQGNAPWNDLARDENAFQKKMRDIRKRGFATMDPEYSRKEYNNRIFALGVPILAEGRIFGAINAIYLRQVLSPDRAEQELLPKMIDTAARMAKAIQARTDAPANAPT